jgi:hypothetical protein
LVLLSRLRQLLPECNRMPGRLADCQALSGWPGAGLLVLLRRACRILSLCQAMLSALAAYHALSVFLDDFLHDRVIDTELTAIRSPSKNTKFQYHYSVVKDRRGLRFALKAQRQLGGAHRRLAGGQASFKDYTHK